MTGGEELGQCCKCFAASGPQKRNGPAATGQGYKMRNAKCEVRNGECAARGNLGAEGMKF